MKTKLYFRKSSRYSCLYHLFTFAFTLACGYIVSLALDAAIASQESAVYGRAAVLGVILLIGLPILYVFVRGTKKQKELDAQAYREALYREVMENRLPVQHTGELDVRLHMDARTVTEYIQDVLPKVLEGCAIIVGSTLILCSIHALVGGLLLAMGFLQLIPTLVYEKWAKSIYEESVGSEADYEGWIAEGAEGLRTLKAYGREVWFVDRYRQLNERLIRAGKRSERTSTWESIIYEGIHSVLYYGSYLWIGFFIMNGTLPVTDAPMMIILSGYIYQSMGSVFEWIMKRYEYQMASAHLKTRQQRDRRRASKPLCVMLKNVTKRYGEKVVLQDVSFSIREGERVLLCGPNGSGKTTLLRIILGLEEADAGEVQGNMAQFAYALQEEPSLHLSGKEVMEGLQAQHILDQAQFVEHLRQFSIEDALLAQPMDTWSMGECKKFYLAAALARPCRMLVLDEPTNHLDKEAVAYLQSVLAEYPGGLLVCSHEEAWPVKWDRIERMKRHE